MGLACASCVARSRIRSGTSRESGMIPPYGYNSRKNTLLPPYSHAVLTSMGCTPPRGDNSAFRFLFATIGVRDRPVKRKAKKPSKKRQRFKWTTFICHVTADKKDFVKPLGKELQKYGVNVWLDEFILKAGDSLRQKIDEGLSKSRYGVGARL